MNPTAIYDAVVHIREDYLDQSGQFPEIAAGYRAERRRNLRIAGTGICCAAPFAAGIGLRYGGASPQPGMIPAAESSLNAQTDTSAGTEKTDSPVQTEISSQASLSESGASDSDTELTEPPAISTQPTEITSAQASETQVRTTAVAPFMPSADPDTDAYGDDQIHAVTVQTGDAVYRQLSEDEYGAYRISLPLKERDFGASLGIIAEIMPVPGFTLPADVRAGSQEPELRGAEAYYYAPSQSRAVLIVRKDAQCSLFVCDAPMSGKGFAEAFAFYNSEIAEIICTKSVPEQGSSLRQTVRSITDRKTAAAIRDLLCTLTPEDYSALPAHIGTPAWEAEARAAYRADPVLPREDYSLQIRFANGTVMQTLVFQPYIGSGYFSGMQELTADQCAALKALLDA